MLLDHQRPLELGAVEVEVEVEMEEEEEGVAHLLAQALGMGRDEGPGVVRGMVVLEEVVVVEVKVEVEVVEGV